MRSKYSSGQATVAVMGVRKPVIFPLPLPLTLLTILARRTVTQGKSRTKIAAVKQEQSVVRSRINQTLSQRQFSFSDPAKCRIK